MNIIVYPWYTSHWDYKDVLESVKYCELQKEIMLYGLISAIEKTEKVFESVIDDVITCLSNYGYYEHVLELFVKVFLNWESSSRFYDLNSFI